MVATKAQLIGSTTAAVHMPARGRTDILQMLDDEWVIVQFLSDDPATTKFTSFDEARSFAEAALRQGRCRQLALITKFALDLRTDVWASELASLDAEGAVRYRGFEAFA
jgi:hypothetical protein